MSQAFAGNAEVSFGDAITEASRRAALTRRRYRVWYDRVNHLWSFTELTQKV